jgi:hypothetical protein
MNKIKKLSLKKLSLKPVITLIVNLKRDLKISHSFEYKLDTRI